MIRNGKIETKKASDRADQPFGLSQPQPEDGSQGQRRCNRQLRILRLTTPGGGFCCNVWHWLLNIQTSGASTFGQTATSNSPAMKAACAMMSSPLIPRTCPFLIIAIAS
jgi:hypothetical protein